jgi:hypothetical protein
MDILNLLIARATEADLLQPLSSQTFKHRLSLYADDVVFFLQPTTSNINTTTTNLQLFREASGLNVHRQMLMQFKRSSLPRLRTFLSRISGCHYP